MNINKLQTRVGKSYIDEKEGQRDFFDNFRIDYQNNDVLIDNTDGVWNGNLFEFKLSIDNLHRTLKQAIKYLSRMRIKGEAVPANILMVSLNTTTVYLYHSKDYFDEIHTVYIGAASKNNDDFVAKNYVEKYDYSVIEDAIQLQQILKQTNYLPIQINEDCIVGWVERFYRENPSATKGDFIGDSEGKVKITGEIREPKHLKGLILPYKGKSNERFKYLMDKLNDRLNKKELGAFYTPIKYCEKAIELVRKAILQVPKGNDYVIIDRCAGTGNLQSVLSDEELSHCILSTYEYYEYKVLCERLGDKVRFIIPPTENLIEYSNGYVMNANALSQEYVENESIQKYIKNDKCTIILLENPPYQDSSSITFTDGANKRAVAERNNTYVKDEFKKELSALKEQRGAARDVSNLFIWSAFKYYLREPNDCYILFSPVKYFKSIGLVNKEFVDGYIFNRKHFHASPSAISCILWRNRDEYRESWELKTYDIDSSGEIEQADNKVVRRVHNGIAYYNDRRRFDNDFVSNIVCQPNGYEKTEWLPKSKQAYHNKNIIAYLATIGNSIDAKHRYLTRLPYYVGVEQSFGYYLRADNYISKLPIYCAKLYPQSEWHNKDVYFNSSDKLDEYLECQDLLRASLIYTCLTEENKCRSIIASNGNLYQNELCFDIDTIAYNDLQTMTLTEADNELIGLWKKIISEGRKTEMYNDSVKYGVYQIQTDLNTYYEDEHKKRVYHYTELNSHLTALKSLLKSYYKKNIEPFLFEYELIK